MCVGVSVGGCEISDFAKSTKWGSAVARKTAAKNAPRNRLRLRGGPPGSPYCDGLTRTCPMEAPLDPPIGTNFADIGPYVIYVKLLSNFIQCHAYIQCHDRVMTDNYGAQSRGMVRNHALRCAIHEHNLISLVTQ